MRCPFCGHEEDRVLDTRSTTGARAIRRRRECIACERRFTTYEQIEEQQLIVVKKDQRREPFDRNKLMGGLKAACQKRPVATSTLESIIDDIERTLYNDPRREIKASEIGAMVMEHLRTVDSVAYVRFASVYQAFADPAQFREFVDSLAHQHPLREPPLSPHEDPAEAHPSAQTDLSPGPSP